MKVWLPVCKPQDCSATVPHTAGNHGIQTSCRTLKRRLQDYGLSGRDHPSTLVGVWNVVRTEHCWATDGPVFRPWYFEWACNISMWLLWKHSRKQRLKKFRRQKLHAVLPNAEEQSARVCKQCFSETCICFFAVLQKTLWKQNKARLQENISIMAHGINRQKQKSRRPHYPRVKKAAGSEDILTQNIAGLQDSIQGQCYQNKSVPNFVPVGSTKFAQIIYTQVIIVCATNLFSIASDHIYIYDSTCITVVPS